jgi:hypothetical protein
MVTEGCPEGVCTGVRLGPALAAALRALRRGMWTPIRSYRGRGRQRSQRTGVTHETSPEASSSNQPARTHSSIRHANAPIAEVTGIRGGTSRFVPGIPNICTMPRCLAQPRSPRLKTGDTLISVNHCTASVETASAQMGWSGCVSDELYDSSCSIDRPSTDPHPRRPVLWIWGPLKGVDGAASEVRATRPHRRSLAPANATTRLLSETAQSAPVCWSVRCCRARTAPKPRRHRAVDPHSNVLWFSERAIDKRLLCPGPRRGS